MVNCGLGFFVLMMNSAIMIHQVTLLAMDFIVHGQEMTVGIMDHLVRQIGTCININNDFIHKNLTIIYYRCSWSQNYLLFIEPAHKLSQRRELIFFTQNC
jgi:hypothetical protein